MIAGFLEPLRLSPRVLLAEAEGFEPPVPCGTAAFKAAAFDHSATLPSRPTYHGGPEFLGLRQLPLVTTCHPPLKGMGMVSHALECWPVSRQPARCSDRLRSNCAGSSDASSGYMSLMPIPSPPGSRARLQRPRAPGGRRLRERRSPGKGARARPRRSRASRSRSMSWGASCRWATHADRVASIHRR